MVAIVMMSAELPILGVLEIKVPWNKGYDVIIYVHNVKTNFYQMTQIIF